MVHDTDNPRDWARPDDEGDPWHSYWDPDQRLAGTPDAPGSPGSAGSPSPGSARGRRYAIAYLIAAPLGLVLTLLVGGLIGAVCGLVANIGAVLRLRRYGERAPGFTVAGGCFIVIWLVITVVRAVGVSHAGDLSSLATGDCFTQPANAPVNGYLPGRPATVPCDQPHNAEVVGGAPGFDAGTGRRPTYPGAAKLTQLATDGCRTVSRDYVLDPLSVPVGMTVHWYLPRRSQWTTYPYITCILSTDRTVVSRSVRETTAELSYEQIQFIMAIRDFDDARDRLDGLLDGGPWAQLQPAVQAAADEHQDIVARCSAVSWPAGVQPDMDAYLAAVDGADTDWQRAAAASDGDDARRLVARAEAATRPGTETAVRRDLGLSTGPGEPLPGR